jgi:DNA-binding IclR family transcriptional regulator
MPARHHRTVDRVIAIMEEASRGSDGVSLAELAERLDAPKSSIQELTNGLLATGYLVERGRRFLLGPGPFVLSIRTAGLSLRQVEHDQLERASERLGHTLFVGARVGDDQVFVDQAGQDVLMDFVAATRPRRPLLITATGKVLLAFAPTTERNDFLVRMEREQPERVAAFVAELPAIRETRLAFNRGATVPGRYAVATPLIDPDGTVLAAICLVAGADTADALEELGCALREAIGQWQWPRKRRAARA